MANEKEMMVECDLIVKGKILDVGMVRIVAMNSRYKGVRR